MAIYRVTGEVQGVNLRSQVTQRARELRINGWIRNEPDGSVTLVAQGQKENNLIEWIRDIPGFAKVSLIEKKGESAEKHKGFSIRY